MILLVFYFILRTHSYRNINYYPFTHRLQSSEINFEDIDFSKLSEDEKLAMLHRKRQVDTLRQYLNPIASGLAKEMDEAERKKEFGEYLNTETEKRKYLESIVPHDYLYPPTTQLPFTSDKLRSRIPYHHEDKHKIVRAHIPTRQERFNYCKNTPPDFKERDPYRTLKAEMESDPNYKNPFTDMSILKEALEPPLDGVPEKLNEGWERIPSTNIFKHKMIYPTNEIDPTLIPNEKSCVFVKFEYYDAETNRLIYSNKDFSGDFLAIELENCHYSFKTCLMNMYAGEMAEFVMPIQTYNPYNADISDFVGVNWIRLWVYMNDSHDGTFKWWDIGSMDTDLFPKEDMEGKTKEQYWEEKTDQMAESIKAEMAADPSSQYWHDALKNMSERQKKAARDYFEREGEEVEKMEHMEYSGSRGFVDAIKETGQFHGIDVGNIIGGRSTHYCFKENAFTMYLGIPVKPGIRAQHVEVDAQRYKLAVKIGGKTVLEDDLIGAIDIDQGTNWCMSDEAMKYEPLDEIPDEPLGTTLFEDDFEAITKVPSIIITVAKADHHQRTWGSFFVTI